MGPIRLQPEVELPVRRGRAAALGAALALLFSLGAYNYMATTRARYAGGNRNVALDFKTEPSGALVVRERDGGALCLTPCRVGVTVGRFGIAGFRLTRLGYEDQRVVVDLRGGDTSIDAVLSPLP